MQLAEHMVSDFVGESLDNFAALWRRGSVLSSYPKGPRIET